MVTSLTDAQVAQFKEDGFLFPVDALSTREATAYRNRFEALERSFAERRQEPPINHYLVCGSAAVALPLAAELTAHPKILDAVESLLGPNLMVWGTSFFIKEPGDGKIVSWHQDLTYWGLGETSQQVTAWLALSPSTVDSGCMRFVAGSHKQPIQPHRDTYAANNQLSRGQEIAVEVREEDARDVVLAPGQISLHHGLMFHGSNTNRSQDRRIGLAIRYITPEVRQLVGDRDYVQLVRGVDRQRNFIHIDAPRRDFDPAAFARHKEIVEERASVNFRDLATSAALHSG